MTSTDAVTAYTVNEYCGREKISRALLYKEWKEGRGPKFYHRGARRLISVEAADEYPKRNWSLWRTSTKSAATARAPKVSTGRLGAYLAGSSHEG